MSVPTAQSHAESTTDSEVGPARPEKTAFDLAVEALIVTETQTLLGKIDRLAREHGVSAVIVSRAVDRFGGADLADCWDEYAEEQ